MIGTPLNDEECLGAITEIVGDLVERRDPVFERLAAEHPSTDALAGWIRSLPQRDDNGDPREEPKVHECSPPQRLRLPAPDPNCVERAALYVGVAEFIDPTATRRLATVDTPIGMHTFPVQGPDPVILDPRVTRNCLDCGLALLGNGPLTITPHEAIEWTAELAVREATDVRNGASRVRRARNAMMRLVDKRIAPTDQDEIDSVAWLLNLAERAAKRYGRRALAIVRTTALAVADLIDEALARSSRNLSLEIGGTKISPAPWFSSVARIAGRVGLDVGALAVRTQLAGLGVSPTMLAVVEDELRREGYSLGPLTKPSRYEAWATLAGLDTRRTS